MTSKPVLGVDTEGPRSGRARFIAPLHGLRGLLALWVFMFHANPSGIGFLKVSSYGYIAVDVFFILSGYVLMQAHVTDFPRLTCNSVFAFLRLRAWRTYPLYLACLLLSVALYPLLKGGFPSVLRMAVGLLLLEGWAFPGIGINIPIWSLGVEWVGYQAFPLIAFSCPHLKLPVALALLASLLGGEIAALWNLSGSLPDATTGLAALIRMAAGFGAGCLLWVLHHRLPDTSSPTNDILLLGCCAATAGVLYVLPWVCAVPPLTALVHCTGRPGTATARVLGHPVALFMGRISFAVYLCHSLVIEVVSLGQPTNAWEYRLLGTLVAGVGAIGLATVLCVGIEEPARRFGRRSASRVPAISKAVD